ncbi:aspartate aminotransferase family protein [Actinomadura fibrosa]|uniref:Aspartate aminotransferase family protein n=1 Tax=Actinomadura fibrosa TaxID=111802 RepID=A0ABW2XUG2_9ACTN|nr:aspartate aminotransferase family protein [Actinomadura fibrosa]
MSGGRDEVVKLYERHVSAMAARSGLPVETRSEGAWVHDDRGRALLDCGGYGVFLLGHRHPAVVAAVHAQLDRHPLATRTLLSAELAAASARLAGIAPPGLDHVYFACSGAEAVETALKLARAAGRRRVVAMSGGFHGKTLGALSVTDRPAFQRPFRPLLPDVSTVPYGDAAALGAELAGTPGRACVIVEPVQGEGGVRVPPDGYLAAVAEECRRHDAFLVVDEIQTGLGRLGGTWWGCDREGVVPDVLLAGKSLGGGCVPVSAVIGTDRAFRPIDRSHRLHSSTFGGAPLAMAAVTATIGAIERDGLLARAEATGARLLAGLRAAAPPGGPVREVRGRGLLIGVELAAPDRAAALTAALLDRNVITSPPLGADTVVRLCPPAVWDEPEIGFLLGAFRDAVAAL